VNATIPALTPGDQAKKSVDRVAKTATYRWDINLYRALAVIAVLLFHLRIPGFEQGFLGVDLFFLISGYVITQSLERHRGETFSASNFFLGRAYRIFPMVGFTVLLTLILAVIFLAPTDLVKAAQSGLATLFSVANIYFWSTIDYFDPASAAKPLLHMWSLGVEEQFYLVFPLVFIAFASLAGRRMAIMIAFAVMTALTLGVALSGSVSDSSLFYLLPFRMNQFLAGSVAFYIVNGSASGAIFRKVIWIGLSLVLLAISLWLNLPEEYRLSAFITFAVMPLFVLSWSGIAKSALFIPLHRIADWSYSIYVLHWPIIAFWVVVRGDLGMTGTVICGALTILAAWLTYRFIERPYQKRRRTQGSWRDALKTVIAPMGLIAAIALALIFTRGLAFRAGDELTETFEIFEKQRDEYFADIKEKSKPPSEFSGDKISIVLMGDSFAGDMNALIREIPGVETAIGAATTAYCRALTIPRNVKETGRCEGNWDLIDRDFSKADIIFIAESSASFGFYDETDQAAYEAVFKRLRDNGFKGRFVLSGIRPLYNVAPYQMAYAAKTLDGLRERAAKELVLDSRAMNIIGERMSIWAQTQDVTLLPLFPVLCDRDSCAVTNSENDIIYIDSTHFSAAARPLVIDTLADVLLNGASPLLAIPSIRSEVSFGDLSDREIAKLPDKFGAVKLALLRFDTESATRLGEAYLDELDEQDITEFFRKLWFTSTDLSSRRATLLLAERQLLRANNVRVRNLVGIAYDQGSIVKRDDAKVVEYWEHPSLNRLKTVQSRLAEIYGNPQSELYDPNKAKLKLAAVDAIDNGLAKTLSISSDKVSTQPGTEIADMPDGFSAIRLALFRSEAELATEQTDAYLDRLEGENISEVIRDLWQGYVDPSSRRATLLLAERQLLRANNVRARYLVGLAYDHGSIVKRDDAKVVEYWDHTSLDKFENVQSRLAEIYIDPQSEFYNPDKAALKLTLSHELRDKPK